ncbi:hypothetical protein GPJ56_000873 [Histomonas meleagridis]|uniref:uncharacterized protein n=1 Tax=Histomonas meleagridis TaxID=135588 RepID=UPI0035598DBD|nr:hypothetical protein GPJ56_000873 [Histomonas meleagridis]KAH0801296.1 hypothetical protein GO595_005891 [Histomonas meleagridis]
MIANGRSNHNMTSADKEVEHDLAKTENTETKQTDGGESDFFKFSNEKSQQIPNKKEDKILLDIEEEEDTPEGESKPQENTQIPSFEFNFEQNIPTNSTQTPDFKFNFDDFKAQNSNDESSFSFDLNEKSSNTNEEKLYNEFTNLISSGCFDVTDDSLVESFRQVDQTIDEVYEILIQDE